MNRMLALVVVVAVLGVFGCGGGGAGGGGNQDPVISSLTSTSAGAWPSGQVGLTCTATDANGDTLTYAWADNGGTITGSGATVTWQAPAQGGQYRISCTVTDGNGGTVVRGIDIVVGATVTGRTVSLSTGQPVGGVTMQIAGGQAVSSTDGTFTIVGVTGGTHQVSTAITSPYTVSGSIQVTISTPGSTVPVGQDIPVFSGPPPPPFG